MVKSRDISRPVINPVVTEDKIVGSSRTKGSAGRSDDT